MKNVTFSDKEAQYLLEQTCISLEASEVPMLRSIIAKFTAKGCKIPKDFAYLNIKTTAKSKTVHKFTKRKIR